MPEVSEEQLAVLQRGMELLQELSTAPKTRREFEKIVKAVRPDVETSEEIAADLAKPYIEQLEATNAKLDAFLTEQAEGKTAREQSDADAARDAAFARLTAEGYTEDGLEKIKGLMVDRKIADPEAAAALFDRMNPRPVQTVGTWEPDYLDIKNEAVDRDIEGLFADPDRWADRQVGQILLEERSKI